MQLVIRSLYNIARTLHPSNTQEKQGLALELCILTTVFVDTRLWKTKHPRKRFQNFRQSCVLLTDRIEIHQLQPLVWPCNLLYIMLSGCDWWTSIRSVKNTQDWRKFWKRFRGCFVFQSRVSTKTVVEYRGKSQVNTRVKGIPHIWKSSRWHMRSWLDRRHALIGNATGVHVQHIEDITRWGEDMNFLFESWSLPHEAFHDDKTNLESSLKKNNRSCHWLQCTCSQ